MFFNKLHADLLKKEPLARCSALNNILKCVYENMNIYFRNFKNVPIIVTRSFGLLDFGSEMTITQAVFRPECISNLK